MGNEIILKRTLDEYFNKGMEAYSKGQLSIARRNLINAEIQLLKLSSTSSKELAKQRRKRAEEIDQLVIKIEEKMRELKQVSDQGNYSDNPFSKANTKATDGLQFPAVPEVSLDEALKNLYLLEGLQRVKQQVSDLVDRMRFDSLRRKEGLPVPELSMHMVFVGNPGTGKTTVARIIAQIYKALGVLSKGGFVEVDSSDLVAGYIGQTALKTRAVIEKAMGGVLFIDEAYTLVHENKNNDFGQEAIDTLNKVMEDNRSDLCVIVAGYEDKMKAFIESNKGLESRFRKFIYFDDYSGQELCNIFDQICRSNGDKLTEDALCTVHLYLIDKSKNKFTANARSVRNLFEDICEIRSRRVAKIETPTFEELATITIDDIPIEIKDALSHASDDAIEQINKSSEPSIDFLQQDANPVTADDYVDNGINSDNQMVLTEDNSGQTDLLFKYSEELHGYDSELSPEKQLLEYKQQNGKTLFKWDDIPTVSFADISGLEDVKERVNRKVLLPLKEPHIFDGYELKNGGGLFLYGPPGTGKTMIASAIAHEVDAKFCSIKPSDILKTGVGNTEKAIATLFAEARRFEKAVICFDEFDSLAMKDTKSSISRQIRSELLAQIQGVEAYKEQDKSHLMFLIAITNKPWNVDSAFLRPGRFGEKVYVGLPDNKARYGIIRNRIEKLLSKGLVTIDEDFDISFIVENTNGFNCSDVSNLLDRIEEVSVLNYKETGKKTINHSCVLEALKTVHSSVQLEDVDKLQEWMQENDK